MQANNPQTQNLTFSLKGGVVRVTLNRPEVHNAFNPALIRELRAAFEQIVTLERSQARVVVLAGEGRSFCAGADVNWMRESLGYTEEENVSDALRMARMFNTINTCPVPVVGRVQGAALGGGVGLAAVCDVVVASEGAVFGLSEVKLGITPAVISPYVLDKIGRSNARALFLTGERFDASRALQVGLVHKVVPPDALDAEVEKIVAEVLGSGPTGVQRAKELIAIVPDLPPNEAMQLTAETIANLRVSPEGQEGLQAFLEKRKPEWAR